MDCPNCLANSFSASEGARFHHSSALSGAGPFWDIAPGQAGERDRGHFQEVNVPCPNEGGSRSGNPTCRIARSRGKAPEPLFEEMVIHILQRWLHSPLYSP